MARRIKSIAVFVVENDDGDEGIASFPRRGLDAKGHMVITKEPMIASSPERLEELRAVARDLVAGQTLRIVLFNRMFVEESVDPAEVLVQ